MNDQISKAVEASLGKITMPEYMPDEILNEVDKFYPYSTVVFIVHQFPDGTSVGTMAGAHSDEAESIRVVIEVAQQWRDEGLHDRVEGPERRPER